MLEYFKDEKSASRREPPKGFINVRDIVEVERLADKKQTFELLCPGVAHRLMANSEAEADDWAAALRQLIVYRKGDLQTLSLQRILSQGGNTSPLSSSPPSAPMVTSTFSSPLPHPLMIPPNTHTVSTDAQSHSPHVHHTFPTPPESIVTTMPAVGPTQQPHVLQKQGSHDGINPYPSPPSSSDGSSVCGDRSSTSFDSVSVIDGVDSDFFLSEYTVYHSMHACYHSIYAVYHSIYACLSLHLCMLPLYACYHSIYACYHSMHVYHYSNCM